jgi:hypothetical protein
MRRYLLAGYSAVGEDAEYGETCLWDLERNFPLVVMPAAGNVFDCNWSPMSHLFATACAAYGTNVNRGTNTFVRIYSMQDTSRWSRSFELDCPARDINDVLFCPHDENYVAAGATDGKVYIWDIRNPDHILHKLKHGLPLMELDPTQPREHTDTGVRFCSWGHDRTRLHTGSSDGVVKVWDIFRSSDDTHTRDLVTLDSGVYSGAFSSDFSSLLLGEVNGSINLLEVGAERQSSYKVPRFDLEIASSSKMGPFSSLETVDEESGVKVGKTLRESKQIKFRPMGGFPVRQAVQGKKYDGPYDKAEDSPNLRALAAEFQSRMRIPVDNAQCQIPLCRDAVVKLTSEEQGDSGRSVDRIPQELRKSAAIDDKMMVPGMLKCSHCGLPARPRVGEPEQELFSLCERCGFSCFRCGRRLKLPLALDTISCRSCRLEWDIGALGYNLVTELNNKDKHVMVHPDGQSGLKTGEEGLEDMGDLLHLVEDYHHSLWADSLESSL